MRKGPPLRRSARAVFEDEQVLARLDQPELATSQIFDRRRIAPKALRLVPEKLVLGFRTPDRLLENLKFLTLLHGLEQPFFPDERIHEHDAADQQQRVLNGP